MQNISSLRSCITVSRSGWQQHRGWYSPSHTACQLSLHSHPVESQTGLTTARQVWLDEHVEFWNITVYDLLAIWWCYFLIECHMTNNKPIQQSTVNSTHQRLHYRLHIGSPKEYFWNENWLAVRSQKTCLRYVMNDRYQSNFSVAWISMPSLACCFIHNITRLMTWLLTETKNVFWLIKTSSSLGTAQYYCSNNH